MSVLAEMLKKAENGQDRGEIPPGLVAAARSGVSADKRRIRMLLIAALSVAAIAVGALLGIYLGIRPASQRPKVPAAAQPLPVPAAVVQKPISSATMQQAAELKPTPLEPVEKKTVVAVKAVKQSHGKNTVASQYGARRKASASKPEQAAPAAEPAKKAVIKDRATIDAMLFAAKSAESRRDFPAALHSYQKALEADPDNYRIMNNLSGVYLQLGMNQDAFAISSQALNSRPDYVAAIINGGIAQVRMGNEAAARDLFRKAVSLDSANRPALYSLGLIHERSGAMDDALSVYRRLADTGDSQGYLGMARVHERRGNKSEALKLYRDLIGMPEIGHRAREIARERISALDQ